MRNLILFFILISSFYSLGKTTHVIVIDPQIPQIENMDYELDHFRVTLFTENRSDSLVLPRYSNCDHLKGHLEQYNGKFVWSGPSIPYKEVRLEHPRYLTKVYKLNTVSIDFDSVDTYNKKHHILSHFTYLDLEVECETNQNYDYLFWSNGKPRGGFYFPNHLAILLHDTLDSIGQDNFLKTHEITLVKKANKGKLWLVYWPNKKGLKPTKNKLISSLLMDSSRVKDAGALIDTNTIQFISSFAKAYYLNIDYLDQLEFKPVSALKSYTEQTNYITTNELPWGAGLYRNISGNAYGWLTIQYDTYLVERARRCSEQEQLLQLDLEYITLHTHNYKKSGGKTQGKPRTKNVQRMAEILAIMDAIKKVYLPEYGTIDLVIIEQDFYESTDLECEKKEEVKTSSE